MAKLIDLSGRRFGKLGVVSRNLDPESKIVSWSCQCDCGKMISVAGSSLRSGKTQSCGCKQIKDRMGIRYGSGVVIAFAGTKNRKAHWKLKCDCGNEYVVIGASLESGNTRSCGCGHHIDLTGKMFGRLTVIEFSGVEKCGNARWLCRCSCGAKKVVDGSTLRRGLTKSCGCARKEAKVDFTGMTFGHLTVLRRQPGSHRRKAEWICRCICGRETMVSSGDLSSYHTRSCGQCGAMSLLDDLTGRTFGNVTVIKRASSSNPDITRWLYRCVCGRERETYRQSLIGGSTTSCGCVRRFDWRGILYRSRMQVFTAMALDVLGEMFEYEAHTFQIPVEDKLKKYTPDFHLIDSDLWLEVKGTTFRDGVVKFDQFKASHTAILLNQEEVRKLTGRSLGHLYRTWLSGPQACADAIARALSNPDKRRRSEMLLST